MGIDLANPDKYSIVKEEPPKQFTIQISSLGMAFIEKFCECMRESVGRGLRILEFGSGCSTVFFGNYFKEDEIFSIEGNQEWFDKVEKWLKEDGVSNVTHLFHEQTNQYTSIDENNMDYILCTKDLPKPFDLIINDGGMREIVGDFILENADEYLSKGGLYIRHDYEMAILDNWVGFRLDPLKPWVKDKRDLSYDSFCATHPGYELLTTTGNGRAGYLCEFGGVWRRLDYKWKKILENEAKRKPSK